MRKKRRRKIFSFFFGILFFSGLIVVGTVSFFVLTLKIPDLHAFDSRRVAESTKIYDRTGKVLLFDLHENIRRTVIPFDEVPRQLKNATVAIEDTNFYRHRGISPLSIARAFVVNVMSGNIRQGQGGSTITQQLIKNTFLTTERTFERKLKEAVLALKIEQTLTKDEILDLYFNEIPYGSNIYGVEAAAESFFGKRARDLTLAESAYIASIPKAPTHYSPYGNHREELEQRKNIVLKRMKEIGFISDEEFASATEERARFIGRGDETIKAPHFVFYVRELLDEKFGKDRVLQGGLRVITSLDWELQEKAERMVRDYMNQIEEKFNASNASLVGIDPKTGQVLVMVGSRDWFLNPKPDGCTPGVDCRFEPQVNVATYSNGRQPGSSIKPIVYATIFKKGFTPDTVVFDLKTEFNSSCNPDGTPKPGIDKDVCYAPDNYDEIFRGPVSLRNALAQSINVPSVKTLYLAGLNESLKTARDLGITTLNDPDRYGLTLVLGGGEVHLLEMVSAYGVFANDGIQNPVAAILRTEDSVGNVLEEHFQQPKRVMDENVARTISDILSDEEARAPAFGRHSYLYFDNRDVAVKTGTTNDYRDAWVIGYTPSFSLGLWIGNNDNTSMEKRVAGFIAAPLWNAFFKEALQKLPKEEFVAPITLTPNKPVLRGEWRGNTTYRVDAISGNLATVFTPPELVVEKVVREVHSILRWVDKNNPAGEPPRDPEKDAQYELWETPVRMWAEQNNITDQTADDIPKNVDQVHTLENQPGLTVRSPEQNSTHKKSEKIPLVLNITQRFPIAQIDVFLNNNYVGSIKNAPYQTMVDLSIYGIVGQQNTLRVVVYDERKNKTTKDVILAVVDDM